MRRLLASERADRAWGRLYAIGLLLAVLIHVAILLSWRVTSTLTSPFAAAGSQAYDAAAAAGGGGGMQAVEFRVIEEVPEPVAVVPVVEEVVVVEPPPEPRPQPAEEPAPQVAVTQPGTGQAGSGGDSGSDTGPGTAEGTGQGAGGTEGAGEASRLIPPRPRGMILPPTDRPRDLRGQEITVWVFVNAQGRVVADSTRLDPPTRDSGYNRRLMRSASEWLFEPARQAGRAVAAWYPFQIIL
jgi:hypothetical protein